MWAAAMHGMSEFPYYPSGVDATYLAQCQDIGRMKKYTDCDL